MSEFSKLNGYDVKDATARQQITELKNSKVDTATYNSQISSIQNSLSYRHNFQGSQGNNSIILTDTYLTVANADNTEYRPIYTSDVFIAGESLITSDTKTVTISEADGYISYQALYGVYRNGKIDVSGQIVINKEIPIGIYNLGRIATANLPIGTVYFSYQTPATESYLGSIGTDGIVKIYNYSAGAIPINTQLYPVGLSWYFR